MKNNRIWVLAFDDNADGEAYVKAYKVVRAITQGIEEAMYFLNDHDHACIIHDRQLQAIEKITFKNVAPYSLILEAGAHFPIQDYVFRYADTDSCASLKINVNKL